MTMKTKRKKAIIPTFIGFLVLIVVVYSGFVIYFKNHFYFGTSINKISAFNKTVKEFTDALQGNVENYVLSLDGRDGTRDIISSIDIKLKCNLGDKIKNVKAKQNPFNIFKGILGKKDYEVDLGILYDKALLKQHVDKLAFFKEDKIVKPVNAKINYVDNTYVIGTEIMGNKIAKDALYKEISTSIAKNINLINLAKSNVYENPKYTTKSKEVNTAKEKVDKYMKAIINYDFRGTKVPVDSNVIKEFVKIDEDFNVDLDEKKVKKYMDNLAYNYNTVGISRSFATSSGKKVKVNGGNYGWAIDRASEGKALMESIKEGKVEEREPIYIQKTPYQNANEVGKSYVEIDLTNQKMWVYKDGNVVKSGEIVTGNANSESATPEGVYRVNYKQKDAVLKGVGYASPVTFWVPFNNGIGIHDANWRSKFGGEIYKHNGSHGCINSPFDLAQAVFENVQSGTPVICYK